MSESDRVREKFFALKKAVQEFREAVGGDTWIVSGLSLLVRDMRFIENLLKSFGVVTEEGK